MGSPIKNEEGFRKNSQIGVTMQAKDIYIVNEDLNWIMPIQQ